MGNRIKSFFRRVCCQKSEQQHGASRMDLHASDMEEGGVKQYRLEATRTVGAIHVNNDCSCISKTCTFSL